MPSFDKVNYSLRPSKTIERALTFEGIQQLRSAMHLVDPVYVGFGSIWFTDFQIAHKILGVRDLVSIEQDSIGYARAVFNAPYKTVRVRNQISSDALADLYRDTSFNSRPWVIWLDYDDILAQIAIDDIRSVIENAPTNSLLLVTLDVSEHDYGKPKDRKDFVKSLIGSALTDELEREDFDERLPETLGLLLSGFMTSTAVAAGRPGGFVPAFNMVYRDTATMLTVGGVLPTIGTVPAVREVIGNRAWPGIVRQRILAPHLTVKEAATLQAELPSSRQLTRSKVRRLGFDLADEQLAAFERYYRYFPSFAQVSF